MTDSRRLAVLLLASLLALACARAEKEEPPAVAGAKPRATIRVSHKSHMGFAPLYIGKDEGFFEQEGIDLELVALDANSAMFAFTSGQLDVITAPLRSGLFNAMGHGRKIQVVAERGHGAAGQCAAEAFLAPTATADRIAKKGLRGERFAMLRGGSMEFLADRWLAQQGLTRDDIQQVQLPPSEGAVRTREIDAIRFTQEPALSTALANGTGRVVATMEQLAPGLQVGLVAYGPRLLEDRDLGRRFMRAYLRGVRQYREGKTGRNVEIISRYSKLPEEVIRRACWQTISADARVDPKAVEPFFAWARERGYLEQGKPPADWWTNSFIDAAK